ncbi:phosphoribosyltransferase [Parapusillimonas granuli]|uniref:Phosphoribosyltransferase n=1 Tax=Parapusillimonas granuli TaxID=380911 RepID=A0A853G0Y0_9BURK|nr:phosphoribosyltransferase [Parapusillimonas granuli]MBB5213644.1 hypothetical protein [Parapusillimonas granuli]MEB2398736.1 phosphoribosyltransferase [Alcaligenaceae bacterium]NYT48481.1 phosphoribosyltransferase [Parapusillimonas granuli]
MPQHRTAFPYDYALIESVISEYLPRWRADRYDAVVAIARGGLVPATMIATELSLPLHAVAYARGPRRVSWYTVERPRPPCRVLLVEDIAGRGTTLSDSVDFLRGQGYELRVFTLAHDAESRIRPDFGPAVPDGCRAWFPWERHSITDAFEATFNQPRRPEYEYASWAIDLDGVLLMDLPEERYAMALQDTLAERDLLPLSKTLPALDLAQSTIITGRPEQDRARTRAWLDRHGFMGPLIMRDDSRHSAAQTPLHKAEAILARRHTHFIESDPVQALAIARRARLARIIWWNGGDAVMVHAHAVDALKFV